jgi:hypothetical protein
MFSFVLAIISFFGLLASLCIHILAWFGYASPISVVFSLVLLVLAMVIGLLGTLFIFPFSISNATGWGVRRMGHNFWRLIPKKGVMLIRLAGIYGFGAFFVAALFFNASNGFSGLLSITGVSIALFVSYWISYWYHSPVEIREDVISMFKSRKHLKRHRKHEDLSKT